MRIQSENVWLGGQFVPAQLELENGVIRRVTPPGEAKADMDFAALRVIPGLIDVHTHGAYGFDLNSADEAGLRNWLRRIPGEGVTSLCPTTITQSEAVLTAALKNATAVAHSEYEGAQILGVHLEGPFLCQKYKGAQPPEAIVPPSVEQFEQYQDAAQGLIRLITLAPEEDGDYALTRYCAHNGVAVSMGHSAATYDQALFAAANGAVSITHVYNGMSGFNHRQPGMVNAALHLQDLYGEIIADCLHSTPQAVATFYTAKGRDRAIMITDSLLVKGCPRNDTYLFGGHEITVDEYGTARLVESGTIAGSTLQANRGLCNLVERAMVPFAAALNSCTINPARMLGVDDRKGRIAAGWDGDIVVLTDSYDVAAVYCRGVRQELEK